jgi:hypothetical protein
LIRRSTTDWARRISARYARLVTERRSRRRDFSSGDNTRLVYTARASDGASSVTTTSVRAGCEARAGAAETTAHKANDRRRALTVRGIVRVCHG